MKKISSDSIRIGFIVSGILGLAALAILVIVLIASGRTSRQPLLLGFPILLALLGFFVMKRTVWNLVDEVLDGGDFLLLKKGGIEERVPLSNIARVSENVLWRPSRVTLSLSTPCKFGSEISFMPRKPFFGLMQGMESPITGELRTRLRQP